MGIDITFPSSFHTVFLFLRTLREVQQSRNAFGFIKIKQYASRCCMWTIFYTNGCAIVSSFLHLARRIYLSGIRKPENVFWSKELAIL